MGIAVLIPKFFFIPCLLVGLSVSFAKDTLTVLGVFSGSLDSSFSERVLSEFQRKIGEDTGWAVAFVNESVKPRIRAAYRGFSLLDKDTLISLREQIPAPRAVSLFFSRSLGYYECDIRIWNRETRTVQDIAQTRFIPEIDQHPEIAAQNLSRKLIHNLRATDSKATKPRNSFWLGQSLQNATLVDHYEVLQMGQVDSASPGSELWTGSQFKPSQISRADADYALFPNSIYSFAISNSLGLLRGKLVILGKNREYKFFTPSIRLISQSRVLLVYHYDQTSELTLLGGSLKASPLLSAQGEKTISGRVYFSTKGYTLEQKNIKPEDGDALLGQLESIVSKELLDSLLIPEKRYVRSADSLEFLNVAPMSLQEFAFRNMAVLGLVPSGIQLSGEVWDTRSTYWKLPAYEAGCYLCSPNRLGP